MAFKASGFKASSTWRFNAAWSRLFAASTQSAGVEAGSADVALALPVEPPVLGIGNQSSPTIGEGAAIADNEGAAGLARHGVYPALLYYKET